MNHPTPPVFLHDRELAPLGLAQLTPEAVAQMVADREAGTPGPWKADTEYYSDSAIVMDANGFRHVDICNCAILNAWDETGAKHWAEAGCHYDIPKPMQDANARRIARLPNLEAAYLTLAADNATLRASEAAALERIATIEDALSDPIAVHANMLRGTIAMPSFANIKHLYAADFAALTPTADKEPKT